MAVSKHCCSVYSSGECVEKKQKVKAEPKKETGRRKSARLSQLQKASSPEDRKIPGEMGKEPSSTQKKRNRQTSASSTKEEGRDEVVVAADQEETNVSVAEEETAQLQCETAGPVSASVVEKSSQVSENRAVTPKEQTSSVVGDQPLSKVSKSQAAGRGSRVLRSRQRGTSESKDRSSSKKIKLEHSGESLTCKSQQSSDLAQSEKTQESKETSKSSEVSSDNKRTLRKRKQPSGGGGVSNSSKRGRNLASSDPPNSTLKHQPKPSEAVADESKAESESTPDMDEPAVPIDDSDEKCEQLIVRVPTSVTKLKEVGESKVMENDSLACGRSVNEAADPTELTMNEKDPPSPTPHSSTLTNGDDVTGGQPDSTGGQDTAPPSQPDHQSSSMANPQPSSSGVQLTADGDQVNKPDEKDKIEELKKVDYSKLPPMIHIRAGMSFVIVGS